MNNLLKYHKCCRGLLLLFGVFFAPIPCFAYGLKSDFIQPFNERDFTLNNERYAEVDNHKIFFWYHENNLTYFITNKGITIREEKWNFNNDLHEQFRHLKRQDSLSVPIHNYIHLDFENGNFDSIVPMLKLPYTRNHQALSDQLLTIKAPCFSSLEVKSVYEKIDLIVEIAAGNGIKYSFRVRPGGNPNDIKIKTNASLSKNENKLDYKLGSFQLSEYNLMAFQTIDSQMKTVFIENEIVGDTIRYKVGKYSDEEILFIDPWLVSPLSFTSDTKGYEIGTDLNGNVYVLGQTGGEVAAYDNNGNLQWVWTSPNGFVIYGDMVTNSLNGDTYFIYSVPSVTFDIFRLDAFGTVISTFDLATLSGAPTETWRLYFNEPTQELILGGGGITGVDPVITKFNADLTSAQVFPTLPYSIFEIKDVTLLSVDKNSDYIYFLISKAFFSDYDNYLFKCELNNPDNIIWDEFADYNFNEAQSVLYCGIPGLFSPNGYNGVATDFNSNLYTYDGNELKKWDSTLGLPIDSISLNKTPFAHGGIDTDICGNIYLGTNDSILIYDDQLNYQGGFSLPDSCYDLRVLNEKLVATGKNFVASFDILENIFSLNLYAVPDVCESNVGTINMDTLTCSNLSVQSISWSPGGYNTPFITDLDSGWYTATVTWIGPGGFTHTEIDSVFVDQIGSITTSIDIQNTSCSANCDGAIDIVALTGNPPFSFTLGGMTNTTGVFSNLCPGWYLYSATDLVGCNFIDSVFIDSDNAIQLLIQTINSPTCYGFNDGSITVTTASSTGTIDYSWTPANTVAGNTFNNLISGNYVVVATDGNNCSDTLSIFLTQPDSIFAYFNLIPPTCYNENTGAIEVDTIIGYQGNYFENTLTLLPNNITITPIQNFENLYAGNYLINISDSAGCTNVIPVNLYQPDSLFFTELGFHSAYCRLFGYQSGGGVVYAAASGGTPDYDYLWTNLSTGETTNNSTWGGLNPGNYSIAVTDYNNCVLQEIIYVDSLNPIANFDIISSQLNANLEGTEIVNATFVNSSLNFSNENDPNSDTVFFWNLNHPITNWIYTASYFFQPDTFYVGESTYEICLVAVNSNGCSDTLCKTILVHELPNLNPPNVFTPGSNSINDLFNFLENSDGIETIKCVIVNRWGNEIITLNDLNDSWDGTDKNGNNCPDGVYFYIYEITFTNGTIVNGQSSLQLISD